MQEMNPDEELGFMVEFSDDEVRTLLYAVTEALRMWPGAPQRPAEEQDRLQDLKVSLFSMTLDMSWERSEGESPS